MVGGQSRRYRQRGALTSPVKQRRGKCSHCGKEKSIDFGALKNHEYRCPQNPDALRSLRKEFVPVNTQSRHDPVEIHMVHYDQENDIPVPVIHTRTCNFDLVFLEFYWLMTASPLFD